MKVINIESLYGTAREVDCPKQGFKSLRFLLEDDAMGYTLTCTRIPQGIPQYWHYKNHLETCLCISGEGILTDIATGSTYTITPGIAYALDKHDAHTFQSVAPETVLICVFNPPLTGREVHQADGSYVNPKKEIV